MLAHDFFFFFFYVLRRRIKTESRHYGSAAKPVVMK